MFGGEGGCRRGYYYGYYGKLLLAFIAIITILPLFLFYICYCYC